MSTNPWLGRLTGQLFIGGTDREGCGGPPIEVVDPSTGQALASVADASDADAIRAVDAAATALPPWSAVAPRRRAEILRRCFELMIEHLDDLAELVSLENGKALADSRSEITYAAEFFRWYSEEAVRLAGKLMTAPSGDNKIVVLQQPIGVAVLVTPWNFPAAMATRKIAPALAAGCTVVLKPATATPLTAYAIAALAAEAGVPDGVINVITTSRSGPVVSAMLHDNRVRKVSFTGSTEVGRTLLAQAADQVLVSSMELGGNAPVIVLEDADLAEALQGVMVAKMRNGGQACTAANRILVHSSIHDQFAKMMATAMGDLVVGPGNSPRTQCGPMIDRRAVAKAHELVTQAVGDGAEVLTGGSVPDRDGSYYPPTVIAGVPRTSSIVSEEIFGPVASLIPFEDDDDAVQLANATEYGLAAYVFGRDLARTFRIAERLESGMVGINRGVVSDPAAPFGGVKQSGIGREGSQEGIMEFIETKYIAVSW
ncbi:MAG: NAD-dependent succinate-semialdehyde dehydrogenase [Propionibacteriaceae bacterium]